MFKLNRKEIFQGIAVSLTAIVVFLLAFEFVLLVFFPQELNSIVYDENLGYRMVPNLRFVHNGFEQKLNSYSFRDVEHSLAKPDGTYRVLVLGDSFVQGERINFEDLWTRKLEAKLNENAQGKKFEVISAGVQGYSTENELKYYLLQGKDFSTDLVVVAFFLNDIHESTIKIYDNTQTELFRVENGVLVDNTPIKINLPKRLFMECASFLQVCAFFWQNFTQNPFVLSIRGGIDPARNALTVEGKKSTSVFIFASVWGEIFFENIPGYIEKWYFKEQLLFEKLRDETKSNNSKFLVVLIPSADQVDDAKFALFEKNLQNSEAGKVIRDAPQQKMRSILNGLQIDFVDLLEPFIEKNSNNDFYNSKDSHWNAKGNDLAADIVSQKILGSLK